MCEYSKQSSKKVEFSLSRYHLYNYVLTNTGVVFTGLPQFLPGMKSEEYIELLSALSGIVSFYVHCSCYMYVYNPCACSLSNVHKLINY